ncbi:MAG: hypothetical protein COB33_008400 [Thiotrichaceae bacterium]|nr:hypothetical protein [Thiotrichaceae bacterium]
MRIRNLNTIALLDTFLPDNQHAAFSVWGNKAERYHFIRKTRVKFSYKPSLKKRKVLSFAT